MKKSYILDKYKKNILKKFMDDPTIDKRIRKTCEVVLNYSDTQSIEKTMRTSNLSKRAIYYHLEKYEKQNGFPRYAIIHKNESELVKYEFIIAKDFYENHVYTIKQAMIRIEEITKIKRSYTQVRHFLIQHRFKKNSKGFYYNDKYQSRLNKMNRETREEKVKKNIISESFLYKHSDEIEEFIYTSGLSDYKEISAILEKVKLKYPQVIESEEEFKNYLMTNTSLF